MQKSLEYTQHNLNESTDHLKQAISAIRERDYVITKLRESENALVDRAGELRKELDAAVQDVTGLFAKIGKVPSIACQGSVADRASVVLTYHVFPFVCTVR